ncbi:uncharacterized protein LOC126056121 [Helicoverpa armigera]|uniref:uncharacterized protein LOC126056121 n=1 Tax=Helicoverpa armigera TaxID=29058 RepID=UPI003083EA1F
MENNMTEEKNQENKQNMEYSEENECKIKIQKVMYTVKPVTVLEYCFAMFKLNVVNKYLDTFVTDQDKKDITVFIVKERKKESKETLNFIGRASENNVKIRDLAAIYDILGRTCMMINKAYNFSLLMILTNSLAFILITFWQALSFYQSQEMDSSDLIYMAVWCISTISNLIALAFGCERLLRARNKTRILVNKIVMDYDLPRSMRVQAKAFMELVEVWPLHIYIYDMFTVDITLILKFISVATTYLIVIIQISHLI